MNKANSEAFFAQGTKAGAGISSALSSGVISTPPPPRKESNGKKAMSYLFMLGFALVGALAGYFGIRYGGELFLAIPGPKSYTLMSLCLLPLIWLVAAGIHEAGHVVGGWMGGGKLMLWLVGPFMLRRTPSGLRFAWNRSVNLGGGMAVCVPLDPAKATPRRVALMALGGPLSSALLCFGALYGSVLLASWEHPVSVGSIVAQNMMIYTALMSFLIFLVTMVPSAVGGFKSDGKRVVELLRGDKQSEQEAAMLVLTIAGLSGVRPAQYDRSLLAKVASLRNGSLFDLYGRLTVYYHKADLAQWQEAQEHLNYVVAGESKLAPFVRDTVRCEYAWLLATQTKATTEARAWLDSAGKLDFDPATKLRAEAAVMNAEGKVSEAAAKAREGLVALRQKSLSPIQSPFAVEAFESIIHRAESMSRVSAVN